MPMPSEGFPLSAAVSPRVHVIETVDSTNAKLLRDAADDPDGHPHLSVVVTRDQRAGRAGSIAPGRPRPGRRSPSRCCCGWERWPRATAGGFPSSQEWRWRMPSPHSCRRCGPAAT
ncbi:hypothetical protein [Microbacterium aurum]